MLTKVQTVWLEESEKSARKREEAERKREDMALNIPIPEPIYMLLSRDLIIDLSCVVSVDKETITLGDKDYTLPVVALTNGEIHTLNEDTNELIKQITRAKGTTQPQSIEVSRPIQSGS